MNAEAPPLALSIAPAPSEDWGAFVQAQSNASVYFDSGWTLLAKEVFGHRVYFIHARDSEGVLRGVLPLVQQRGLLGNFATSIPFFNYGGALAADDTTALALMERARQLAEELRCSYLELRDVQTRPGQWRVRTDKVSMILQLPATVDALNKSLGSKLRSQVKRAEREAIELRIGGAELVDAFYAVFAQNMRDLGTPVYPKKFFEAIVRRFPDRTQLVVIDLAGRPAAAGFLVIDRGRAEIPWAACRADAKPLGLNMRLYWEVLSVSIARGCTSFDFGRSTVDSGTYRFKKQWGAQPLQLYWYRWERHAAGAEEPGGRGESRLMQYATSIWQRLPLPIANVLGPIVSPGLPW